MNKFFEGFEKRSYDYAQEIDNKKDYAKSRHKDKPMDFWKATAVGGGIGAGAGGLAGALRGGGMSALKMGIGGAVIGGISGALTAASDHSDIRQQKSIMKMKPVQQKKYLASSARQDEFEAREAYKAMQRRSEKILDAR